MARRSMRARDTIVRALHVSTCFAALSVVSTTAGAQDPVPRIGPFVVDVHGTFPKFTDAPQLAESRAMSQRELPGVGLGLHAGAHVYVLTWKAVTVGLGADLTLARSRSGVKPVSSVENTRAVTERFIHFAPEL